MKRLIALSLLFLTLRNDLYSDPVESSEIARHLGIYTIRIPKSLLPDYYFPDIIEVTDGKLKSLPRPEYLGVGFKNDGDLVLCLRETEKGIFISLDDHQMIAHTLLPALGKEGTTYFSEAPSSREISEPLILCADTTGPDGKILKSAAPKSYKEIRHGYVLLIKPQKVDQGAAEQPPPAGSLK